MECYTYLRNVTDLLSDGKTPYERRLGNHLKDRLFHLVHSLSFTLSMRRTSQESINLERKSYLDCSSMCTVRGGNLERWRTGRRAWVVGDDGRIRNLLKKTQCERSDISKKKRIYFSNRRWTNQNPWRRPQNIHLDTASTNSRREYYWPSWRIRRVSSTTSRLISGCRWSDKRFLVHVGKLHIPPSRWNQSQTLLAERGIIPYSTEVHWRLENYTYEFGCQAGKTHRWLLEYWWVSRLVRSLDMFHTIYSIGEKTSRRKNVVRGEINKKTAYIQARSSMARALDVNGKARQAEGEAKVV